ncbi:MAG: sugar-binding domain-containing protein, partial [Planctomycetota bacterium]
MANDLPRAEYPRPQFRRDDWLCLNGSWDFEFDPGDTGEHDGFLDANHRYSRQITVPFCMESRLSGIEKPPRMLSVWYRRTVDVPAAWEGRRVLIHFGAVDYDAFVYASVDGAMPVEIGRHRGGFTSFSLDVSFFLGETAGKAVTFWVKARDDWRGEQPRGKQTRIAGNYGCNYTRVTGIWQTVWLEPVPMQTRLGRPKLTPDLGSQCLRLSQPLTAGGPGPHKDGLSIRATVSDEQGEVCQVSRTVRDMTPAIDLPISDDRLHLWDVGDGYLYDVAIELLDGDHVVDRVESYAGMRSVTLDDKAFKLNGRRVFQRLVLDQGWYEDGLLTAPDDAALVRDIELSIAAGFNGARLHQKVFEERFLYHADRLGYLCWGEFADWGSEIEQSWGKNRDRDDHTHRFDRNPSTSYAAEWAEAMERDLSHPCIVGWCPLNELNEPIGEEISPLADTIRALFLMCKLIDPS